MSHRPARPAEQVLRLYFSFSEELVSRIKVQIRAQLSARHVPAVVLETQDIPVSS